MKRFTLFFLGTLLSANFLIAGGLVHNTNQSAAWARMLARGATTDIDAVYFNPAGLTKMGDGFHISLSSQSIFQTKTITSSFLYLNEDTYVGDVSAPVFPSVYAVYKTGKLAFSFGFMPLGGGGGALFSKGVPMMEVPISTLVPTFAGAGVTGYSVDQEFQGTSVYWGIQAGISYAINDNISVFAGARYIMAKNTYKGHLRNIMLEMGNNPDVRADDFLTGLSSQAQGAGESMQPIIDGGGGPLTWEQAVAMDVITPEQSAQLQGGLLQFGFTQEQVDAMNMAQAQGSYLGTATKLGATATLMADQDGDIIQTGNGITPIIGANLSFMEDDLNIGLKYEFQTKMDLTNDVAPEKGFLTGYNADGTPKYMFPDKEVTNADLPAMLSIGVDYRVIDPLKVSIGYHTYFDKQTGWAKEAPSDSLIIDNNFWEFAIGFEYNINESFLLSAGYLRAQTGVSKYYQSNLSYSLTSNTVAFGGAYKINDMFKVNLGGYVAMYDKMEYDLDYPLGDQLIPYKETYQKSTFTVAVGVEITLGSKK